MFFQERLANRKLLKQHVEHYHRLLCSSIYQEIKLSRQRLIISGYKDHQMDQAGLYPVFPDKEHNRNCRERKVSWVLQSPVSSSKTSSEMEVSYRPKQAKFLFKSKKVQDGNVRIHKELSDSRGMGLLNRPLRRLPSHPNPPNLKEVLIVDPQLSDLPVHLSAVRASKSHTSLHNDSKESEVYGPLQGSDVISTWMTGLSGLSPKERHN